MGRRPGLVYPLVGRRTTCIEYDTIASMDYATIREKVRATRRERGLSQQQLAKQSKTGRVTIARFETGKDPDLGLGKLMRLCKELGLEVAVMPQGASDAAGFEAQREHLRRVQRRLAHTVLAARLLLMSPRAAAASTERAAAVLDRWRRERSRDTLHLSRWRGILVGPPDRVARALLRQNDRNDALFADSPFDQV